MTLPQNSAKQTYTPRRPKRPDFRQNPARGRETSKFTRLYGLRKNQVHPSDRRLLSVTLPQNSAKIRYTPQIEGSYL